MKRIINLFVLLTLLALAFGTAVAPAKAAPAPAPMFAPPTVTLVGNCSRTYSMSKDGINLGVQGVHIGALSARGTEVCTLQFSPSIDSSNIILWWWASERGGDTWSLDFNGSNIFNDPGLGTQMQSQTFAAGTSVTDITITHPIGWGNGSIFTICVPGSGYYDFSTQSFAAGDGNCGGASDTTDPIVTVPSNMTVEAASSSGATVTFTATATDETAPANPSVTCVPSSGSTFALGTTTVNCSATDTAGNTGTNSFSVTVQDTTDPVVTVPANMTVEATSSSGAAVTFSASATDTVGPANPTVTCVSPSGSTFALGTTTVNCSATDTAGNTGSDSFDITVQDTTAPDTSIDSSPANPAPTPDAVFTFSGTDAVSVASFECSLDGSAFAACTSGTNFGPLANGSHTFQVRAKDNANNTDASPASYTWTTNVFNPAIFADVPFSHWANSWIETLYLAGVTGGCGTNPLIYCPDAPVTRAQMAIFILRGMYGSNYAPPAATGTVFTDVPLGSFADSWIEQLAADGITVGCGGGNYCPNNSITRAEMSIFLLRGEHGSAYVPPTATGTVFGDVTIGSFAANFIEQLFNEGITAGCGGGNYCPGNPVTRAEMAVFLVKTFNIP